MIDKMSRYIVDNMLLKGEKADEDQADIMLFGVTRILEDIPKFVSIILMCYLLNVLKELAIVFIITILYKTFVGGAHARTNIQCFIVSSVYFILPIFAAKHINYNLYIFYMIFVFVVLLSIYVIIKIAPADTEEIPIINKENRKKLKLGAVISLVIITTVNILFVKDMTYMKLIVYTILLINVFAMPFVYKLLKCKLGRESEEFRKFY